MCPDRVRFGGVLRSPIFAGIMHPQKVDKKQRFLAIIPAWNYAPEKQRKNEHLERAERNSCLKKVTYFQTGITLRPLQVAILGCRVGAVIPTRNYGPVAPFRMLQNRSGNEQNGSVFRRILVRCSALSLRPSRDRTGYFADSFGAPFSPPVTAPVATHAGEPGSLGVPCLCRGGPGERGIFRPTQATLRSAREKKRDRSARSAQDLRHVAVGGARSTLGCPEYL